MTRKQRRLTLIGAGLGVLGLAAGLVLYALNDAIVFFNSPTDVVEKQVAPGSRIRLGGLVKPGSLVRGDNLSVRFEVTDGNKSVLGQLHRHPSGPLPRRAGRGDRRRARCRGHLQGRQRARQARRDLHAEGSRRRAEEAGPLENRRRRLRARRLHARGAGSDPGIRPLRARARAWSRARAGRCAAMGRAHQ